MDDAEALELACVDRGWRYAWLDGVPYMFDERREYLARVSPAVLDKLSAEVPQGTLGEVLHNFAEEPGTTSETRGALATLAGVSVQTLKVRVPITDVCPTIASDPALIGQLVFLQRREGQ